MSSATCPECGLNVSFKRGERVNSEPCPRCLARSSGARSIRLGRRVAPRRVPPERRVVEMLRKRGGRTLGI
jgi:hypothetical protein